MNPPAERFPGFVDLQVNGYLGKGFTDPDLESDDIIAMASSLKKKGVCGFLATMITSSMEIYRRNIPLIAELVQSNEAPNLIGIHLEGPFISSEEGYRGAHPAEFVLQPDPHVLDILIEAGHGTIRMLTMAAGLRGDTTLCRSATDHGIVVSLGHQNAGSEDILRMREAGARALTHFGNGVPLILRRHPNPLWAAAACEGLVTMVVPDGFHLSDDFFSTILRLRSEQEIVFVSDMAPVAGLEPGQYEVFGKSACLGSDGSLLDPKTGLCVGAGKSLLDSYESSLGKKGPGWDQWIRYAFTNPLDLIEFPREKLSCKMDITIENTRCKVAGGCQ